MNDIAETEARSLLLAAENEDDAGLLKFVRGVSRIHKDEFRNIYDVIRTNMTTEGRRLNSIMVKHFSNQLSTVTPGRGREANTNKDTSDCASNEFKNRPSRYERLKDPLYKELLKCLLREDRYNPHTKNLVATPKRIMTFELVEKVVVASGLGANQDKHMQKVSRYIETLSRRLSKCGLKRKNGMYTPPTTFYDEYMLVFGPADPCNLKEVTEDAAHTESVLQSSTDQISPDHIAFGTKLILLEAKIVEDRTIVYKLGQALSTAHCARPSLCDCRDSVPILTTEVYENPYTDGFTIEDTDLHSYIESGHTAPSPPAYYAKDTYVTWPRLLLLEKALTIQDVKEKERQRMANTIIAAEEGVQNSRRMSVDEILKRLSDWVEKQKTVDANWWEGVFKCPKPQNKHNADTETYLGTWLNRKKHEAIDKKRIDDQRIKAIELLNGPVAEILGYQENWWWQNGRGQNLRKQLPIEDNENQKPKRKKRSKAIIETPNSGVQSKPMGPGLRSNRARPVKPKVCADYIF